MIRTASQVTIFFEPTLSIIGEPSTFAPFDADYFGTVLEIAPPAPTVFTNPCVAAPYFAGTAEYGAAKLKDTMQ